MTNCHFVRVAFTASVLGACLAAISCSNDRQPKSIATGNVVSGRVTFQGRPFPLGVVKFYTPPTPEMPPQPVGASPIGEDGAYQVHGLPPGPLIVCVDVDVRRAPGSFDPNELRPTIMPGKEEPAKGRPRPGKGPPRGPGPKGGPKGDPKNDPNSGLLTAMPSLANYTLEKSQLVVTVTSGNVEFNIEIQ